MKEPAIQDEAELIGPSGRLTLYLVSGLAVMAGGLVGPALPGLGARFVPSAPALELRFVLTMPALFMAIAAALSPLVRARLGQRRTLVLGLLVYALAGMAGALAWSLPVLLTTRALLGLATGVLITTVIAAIADAFDGERRTAVLGRQSAFMSVGSIVTAVLGGLLAAIDWRATFLTYGLALVLVVPAARLPVPPPATARDLSPLPLPREMVIIVLLATTALLSMLGFYLLPMLVPFLLPALGVTSPAAAGGALALATAASSIGSLAYGGLRRASGPVLLLAVALAGMAAGLVGLAGAHAALTMLPWMALFGFGMGLLFPGLSDAAALAIDPARRHVAISLVTMGLFLGQFVSPLASEPALAAGGLRAAFGAAALLIAVGGSFLVASLALAMRRTPSAAESA